MDPTACLRRIEDADTRREEGEACEDLSLWLARGGFAPRWSDYPRATDIYRRRCGYHPLMRDHYASASTPVGAREVAP